MSPAVSDQQEHPLSRGDILQYFQSGAEKTNRLIGIEVEKVGVTANTGETACYSGKNGYLAILGRMYEELGWNITKQHEKFILQLKRGKSVLDLESDGRIELAGAPSESIHDIAREFRIHQNEITEISNIFGIGWLGVGYQPISKNKDIEDVPEERKNEMKKFFSLFKEQAGNDFGLAWYKKTAGIHVNIDYFSESDFARKARLLFHMAPILGAIFANSPFSNGEFTGYMGYRSHVTLNNDVPRFHVTKELYESDFSYDAWIDHVLLQRVLFLKKGNEFIYPNMPFSQYMESGYEGHCATMDDFHVHMKSMWMDTRLRHTIEIRCIDSVPPHLVPSVVALIKGLLHNDEALEKAEEIVPALAFHEYQQLQQDAAKHALKASVQDHTLLDIAKRLIELAEDTLSRNKILDINGRDETQFLEPLQELIFVKGMSPAEWTIEMWQGEWNQSMFPVLDWYQY